MDSRNLDNYWFIWCAERFVGTPYKWGGDDYDGIDCSGLVIQCLRSVGAYPENEDDTANGLWHKFKKYEVGKPKRGSLLFWFHENGKAYHIAIALDEKFCITAHRGGRHVTSREEAFNHNAFVEVRPINHRSAKMRIAHLF